MGEPAAEAAPASSLLGQASVAPALAANVSASGGWLTPPPPAPPAPITTALPAEAQAA